MKISGTEFVPLNEPLRRGIETLAAGAFFATFTYVGVLGVLLCVYLFFTRLWWLSLMYLSWLFFDRNTCETGGRPSRQVPQWAWWFHLQNYFPAHLLLVPNFKLDLKKNYLLCCFPHGILPCGAYTSFVNAKKILRKTYPKLTLQMAAMTQIFYLPFTKEISLALGGISCSAKSLRYVLSKPEGGNCLILFPGGAAEAGYARPGPYRLVLKERKGFIKMALTTGASLVPVFTFGEIDVFEQIQNPFICGIQKFFKQLVGVTLALPVGRGYLQTSFGLIPRRKPLFTIVGLPINVDKVENPSQEQIDELHQKFVKELVNLFEIYKYKYLEDPENQILELL